MGWRQRPRVPMTAASMIVLVLLGSACSAPPDPAHGMVKTAGPGRPTTPSKDPRQCRRTLVGVAHPDDDLFFMNPEIRKTIRAGCPVDTVYLTAGDDGKTNRVKALEYVDRREYGVRAAYAEMAEVANRWKQADVRADGLHIRSYRLADKARDADVRLTFLDLHDGGPHGQQANSLLRLFNGSRKNIRPFQGTHSYTEDRLLIVLTELVRLSSATRILTMDHDAASFAFGLDGKVDHSDHGVGATRNNSIGSTPEDAPSSTARAATAWRTDAIPKQQAEASAHTIPKDTTRTVRQSYAKSCARLAGHAGRRLPWTCPAGCTPTTSREEDLRHRGRYRRSRA